MSLKNRKIYDVILLDKNKKVFRTQSVVFEDFLPETGSFWEDADTGRRFILKSFTCVGYPTWYSVEFCYEEV